MHNPSGRDSRPPLSPLSNARHRPSPSGVVHRLPAGFPGVFHIRRQAVSCSPHRRFVGVSSCGVPGTGTPLYLPACVRQRRRSHGEADNAPAGPSLGPNECNCTSPYCPSQLLPAGPSAQFCLLLFKDGHHSGLFCFITAPTTANTRFPFSCLSLPIVPPPSPAPGTLQHKRFLNPIGTLFLFSQIAPAAYVLLPAATRFASTIANRRSPTREKGNCKDPIFLLPPGHIFLIEVLHHHIHANSIIWLARFSHQNHSFHVRRPLGDIHDKTADRYSYHRRQTHALTGSAEHWETSTPASVTGNKIDSPRSVISPPPPPRPVGRPRIHVGFPLSSFHFPIFYFSLFSLDLSPRNGVHIFSAATKYSLPSHSYRLRLFT